MSDDDVSNFDKDSTTKLKENYDDKPFDIQPIQDKPFDIQPLQEKPVVTIVQDKPVVTIVQDKPVVTIVQDKPVEIISTSINRTNFGKCPDFFGDYGGIIVY